MEAFSDGVIAILITIMVLGLNPPRQSDLAALRSLAPIFISYVLSFLNLGIYWVNHHHLLQASERVDGRILWANLHLLFWLSFIPFGTSWINEAGFSTWPVALYGIILLLAGIAYYLLSRLLIARHGRDSVLAKAVGRDTKGILSVVIYAIAILLAFVSPWLAYALYYAVAILWVVPDRRIERTLTP